MLVLLMGPTLLHKVYSYGQTISKASANSVISVIIVEAPGARGNHRLPRRGKNFYEGSSRENFVRHRERK